jgi:hypothetical protein
MWDDPLVIVRCDSCRNAIKVRHQHEIVDMEMRGWAHDNGDDYCEDCWADELEEREETEESEWEDEEEEE